MRELLKWLPQQYMLDTLDENPALAHTQSGDGWCALRFGHYLFLGGRFCEEAANAIKNEANALNVSLIYCPDEDWKAGVRGVLGDIPAWGRRMYARAPEKYEGKIAEIEKIDAEKLEKYANSEMFIEEVTDTGTYSSMEDFFKRGMGFAPVVDGAIRGFITSEYPSEGVCAIGIEVEEAYQRRGWAKEMTRQFLSAAADKSIKKVYWECWTDNEASVKTALACGFELCAEYEALEYWRQ